MTCPKPDDHTEPREHQERQNKLEFPDSCCIRKQDFPKSGLDLEKECLSHVGIIVIMPLSYEEKVIGTFVTGTMSRMDKTFRNFEIIINDSSNAKSTCILNTFYPRSNKRQ